MYFQDLIFSLKKFWASQGAIILTPYHTEVGAGTMNPATFFRSLGKNKWSVAYVEPSIRPTDGRYTQNPNRWQHYFQFQVLIKPSPLNIQDIYINSLKSLDIDPLKHDIRFVEDNWESPSLGAWGVGWEVWLDGMEITQFTYFQQVGGLQLDYIPVEITYGLERLAMYLQEVDNFLQIKWNKDFTYSDIYKDSEIEFCKFNFEYADIDLLFQLFNIYKKKALYLYEKGLVFPAYDFLLKCSHTFNLLDARSALSIMERTSFMLQMRDISGKLASLYLKKLQDKEN